MAVPPPVRKTRAPTNIATGTHTYPVAAPSGADVDVCSLNADGRPARAIYIGGAGTLVVQHPGDYDSSGTQVSRTLAGLVAGAYLPVAISKLVASGSTATNVILIF